MQRKHFFQFSISKNVSYFKTLINVGTYITYNENIASFNVCNMSVILQLDIGVFSSNMQEQYESC
jgi:hypothetical protein